MIELREILQRTGISQATLNKYVKMGLIGKPEVKPAGQRQGFRSFYPEDTIERIKMIQQFKSYGLKLQAIKALFNRRQASLRVARKLKEDFGFYKKSARVNLSTWLQEIVELLLLEKGVFPEEVPPETLGSLRRVEIDRTEDGDVLAIKIVVDKELKRKLVEKLAQAAGERE